MNSQQQQYYNISSVTSVHQRHQIASQIEQQKLEIQKESQEKLTSDSAPKKQNDNQKIQRKVQRKSQDVSVMSKNVLKDMSEEDFNDNYDEIEYDYNESISSSPYSTVQKSQKILIDGVEFDIYGNQEGEEFDLGQDGAFNDFSVVAGIFYSEVKTAWDRTVGAALQQKGFRSEITTDENEFIKILKKKEHDVAIVVSGAAISHSFVKGFKQALLEFHHDKRGLFIFGDNDPYYAHANVILPDICNTVLVGNNPGGRLMKFGENPKVKGYFDESSMIFAGINSLFEGITICYPEDCQNLQVIATGTDGKACICQKERTDVGGRVVIDSGFTKLYCNWDSAGQARYIINACVYLVDIEGRFGGDEPTIATRPTDVNPDLKKQIEQQNISQTTNTEEKTEIKEKKDSQCSIF